MNVTPKPAGTGRRRPDLDTVFSINEDGSRNFIQTADVKGRWQVRKDVIFATLLALFLGMPWLSTGGRPLIHFDLPGRAAHLFGATFTNQDFYLAFFLVSGFGFALFVATSLWGRVWCGYVCPQTVFMEGVIRKVERWIEGPRPLRLRRNQGSWTWDKIWRKTLKQALFVIVALGLSHAFVSYFVPVREILLSSPWEHRTAFLWTLFWAGVLYFDFAWFREQTCLIICPYGRLQSALVDPDTVIIGYDEERGEPRSKATAAGGDCVDCFRCVEVCPTGIDIRNGLQMECIGCANCIDACDEVMDKIGRPRGLVRYDSQRGLEGGGQRRFLRPRVWIYLGLAVVGLVLFTVNGLARTSFQVNALRTAGMPFTLVDGRIRNLYTLHLQNKNDERRTYEIVAQPGDDGEHAGLEFILPQPRVELNGLEDLQVPIFAEMPRAGYDGSFEMHFLVTDTATGETERVTVRFRGP